MPWSRGRAAAGVGAHGDDLDARRAATTQVLAIAERFPTSICSVGTHPHHAHEELDVTADELVARARHPKVVAIGEAGLDYHYDNTPRDAQEQGFRTHIAAARETGLPLVIHAREADDDMARILEEEMGKGAFPAVLHCFTGGPELARRAVALGLYISFTGILTFKNSDDAARDRRRRCRRTASWSRPTRRISRRGRIAASATSRPMSSRPPRCWPRCAASRSTRSRARPPRISSACSPKCRAPQRRAA